MDDGVYRRFAEQLNTREIQLPISPTYQQKLAKLCRHHAKHNGLWDTVIAQNLMIDDLDLHVPLFENKIATYGDAASWFAHRDHHSGQHVQQDYPFFTNPLRRPAYGPGRPKSTGAYAAKWEPPSHRAVVAPFWVFTYEYDDDTDGALQTQCDWVWKTGATGQTELQKIDAALRAQFKDYRGYCVVWSGGKSLHIHFIFDTSHLSRTVIDYLAARDGKSPEAKRRDHWQGDVRPDVLWDYHANLWSSLQATIHDVSDITVQFDKQMAVLSQKRRLPWGIRIAEAGNRFGCDAGDEIVQIVLEEKISKRAAKGSTDYFTSSAVANTLTPRPRSERAKNTHAVIKIADTALLARVTEYLGREWGASYPKPAYFAEVDGKIRLYFFNHANDKTPSSFIREDYSAVLYCGKNSSEDEKFARLPGGLMLADMLIALLDEDEVTFVDDDSAADGRGRWVAGGYADHVFASNAWGGAANDVRKGLARASALVTQHHPRNVIASAPGAGKSTALLDQAADYRAEDWMESFFAGHGLVRPENGFTVFACQSYDQAREQFDRYIAPTESGEVRPAVLFKSFDQHYQEYCDDAQVPIRERMTYAKSLDAGYASTLLAVADLQLETFQAVTDRKNQAWVAYDGTEAIDGFRRNGSVVIFTSHRMAQGFNSISQSKAWLHPDYETDMKRDAWIDLAKAFRVYRLIHDEISIDDMFYSVSEKDLLTAESFRADMELSLGQSWYDTADHQKFACFNRVASDQARDIGFSKVKQLLDVGFISADRNTVDFAHMPFGVNNSDAAMYQALDGSAYYVRPKSWWIDLRARICVTTTEAHVAAMAGSLRDHDGKRLFRLNRYDGLACFPIDAVPLKLDWSARKDDIADLAAQLVTDPVAPVDLVIADMVGPPLAITHDGARGRNDLSNRSTAIILTFIGAHQYGLLNVLSQRYWGAPDDRTNLSLVQLFYLDRYVQAAGRNRGLRAQQTATTTKLIMSPKLYDTLGGMAVFGTGMFPVYLSSTAS